MAPRAQTPENKATKNRRRDGLGGIQKRDFHATSHVGKDCPLFEGNCFPQTGKTLMEEKELGRKAALGKL